MPCEGRDSKVHSSQEGLMRIEVEERRFTVDEYHRMCVDALAQFSDSTLTSVFTELAMKHCSWAAWCIWSSSSGVGVFVPEYVIRG